MKPTDRIVDEIALLEQMLLARYAQRLDLLQRATEAKRQAS